MQNCFRHCIICFAV